MVKARLTYLLIMTTSAWDSELTFMWPTIIEVVNLTEPLSGPEPMDFADVLADKAIEKWKEFHAKVGVTRDRTNDEFFNWQNRRWGNRRKQTGDVVSMSLVILFNHANQIQLGLNYKIPPSMVNFDTTFLDLVVGILTGSVIGWMISMCSPGLRSIRAGTFMALTHTLGSYLLEFFTHESHPRVGGSGCSIREVGFRRLENFMISNVNPGR
jgi:hypothetical protein